MKKIKSYLSFFESYNRYPVELSKEEWFNKMEVIGLDEFSDDEKLFFKNLYKNNREVISSFIENIHGTSFSIISKSSLNVSGQLDFTVIKLKDSWYVIFSNIGGDGIKFNSCDEFEEVVSFINKNTNIKL